MQLAVQDGRSDLPIFIHSALDDSPLDPYEFRVYATLARRAGHAGAAFEAVDRMAKRIGISPRRVRSALRALEEYGLVFRTEREGQTSVYTLTPQAQWAFEVPATPAPDAGVPRHEVPPTPAPGAAKGTPSKVLPVKEQAYVGDADESAEAKPSGARRWDDLAQRFAEIWNERCGNLTKTRVVSRETRSLLRRAVQRYGEEAFEAMFRAGIASVREDPYWLGARAPRATRHGAPYGLVNYLRHVEEKANQALEMAEGETQAKRVDAQLGSRWYTVKHGAVVITGVDGPKLRARVERAYDTPNAPQVGDEVQLRAEDLKAERFVGSDVTPF